MTSRSNQDYKRVYDDVVKHMVVSPHFFISADYYDIRDMNKAEDYWVQFWKETAEDFNTDMYMIWSSSKQPHGGGPHHHGILSLKHRENLRSFKRVFEADRFGKNSHMELNNGIVKRWEKGYIRGRDGADGPYGSKKRGTMSFREYEADMDGSAYLVGHIKDWVMGESGAGNSSVYGGHIRDEVFCGKSKGCRRHFKKEKRCRSDYHGILWRGL